MENFSNEELLMMAVLLDDEEELKQLMFGYTQLGRSALLKANSSHCKKNLSMTNQNFINTSECLCTALTNC